ncbi:helix-turn-helix transcriptional regulator [Sphaerisporangium sp. NPDC051017]|uniref:helix-turn-helix domain-containing protein n=1 Tax=Sphaerisporangium sp. NPDC051017 TaxID=3154636 RepID=UPI00341E52CC
MPEGDTTGDRVRELRRRRGLTQEALAQQAGLSVGVVKKIEQGGGARIETYHALARAFDVRTSKLFEQSSSGPDRTSDREKINLLPLRQVISPAVTLNGKLRFAEEIHEEPDLTQLRSAAVAIAQAYHRDRYADMASLLPKLIRSAQAAVDFYMTAPEHVEALAVRSEILQLAGRYLTQVHIYDLAHMALRGAVHDAVAAGDRLNAASAIIGQAWILLRQGRLDEAEDVAVGSADEIEPLISRATREELSAWGWLMLRASAAASRNNKPALAEEMIGFARTAGTAVGAEVTDHLRGWGTFGPLTVELKAIENVMVAGKPDVALELSERVPQGFGRATSDNWNRHRLDVARAHAMLRRGDETTRLLTALRADAPEWLRYQRLAADAFRDGVLRTRKRTLTAEQRDLAAFLDIED